MPAPGWELDRALFALFVQGWRREKLKLSLREAAPLAGLSYSVRVEPRFCQFDGADPLAFVISKNLVRRHLKDAQRALIGARLSAMSRHGGRRSGSGPMTIEESASALNVSPRSVHYARRVIEGGLTDLIDMVAAGSVSVSAAAAVSVLPNPDQRRLVVAGPRAIVAEAHRRRGSIGIKRQRYATLWAEVDRICEALKDSRLDRCRSAALEIVRQIDEDVKRDRSGA